jgi:hypothetical protein
VFLTPYVKRPALPASFVAFSGGLPLFAGGGDEAADAADLSKPVEIELALSGQYKARDFSLTTKNFEEFIKNHERSGVDPAVDREHESWFGALFGGGGGEARGWVQSLDIKQASRDGRRSALVGKVELNDLGQHAVKNKHFRYVSIGFDRAGKDRQSGEPLGHVLDHLALVKRPFIEGMRPLSLSLSAQLGRPVEDGDSPMDQLAQQLRTMLGLAADAPEEAIIAAFAKRREQEATTAEQLKALESLAAEVQALKDERWAGIVDKAQQEFRCTPDEAKRYKALTGVARDTIAVDLPTREPRKPAGDDVGGALTGGGARNLDNLVAGDDAAALTGAQKAALAKFEQEHPGMDKGSALIACALANPALFPLNAEVA